MWFSDEELPSRLAIQKQAIFYILKAVSNHEKLLVMIPMGFHEKGSNERCSVPEVPKVATRESLREHEKELLIRKEQ